MGWGTRTLLSAVAGLSAALAPAAWAQTSSATPPRVFLSPDGATIAVLSGTSSKGPIELFDTGCILRREALDTCGRTLAATTIANRIKWASDSKSLLATLVADHFYAIERQQGEPEQGRQLPLSEGTASTIFESALLAVSKPDERGRPENLDLRLYNGRGEPVGGLWTESNGSAYFTDNSGHRLDYPRGGTEFYEHSIEYRALPSGPDIFVWVSKLGARGLLADMRPDGVRVVPIPEGVRGPVELVWDASSGRPAAVFDPLDVYPLEHMEGGAGWVKVAFARMRAADPALELASLEIATDKRLALAQFQDGPGCWKISVLTPDAAAPAWSHCAAWAEGKAKPAVSAVAIPGDGVELQGLLYSWNHSGAARRLLIDFHGGPSSNIAQDRDSVDQVARTFGDRFDILNVDYRGSTGHGETYFYSLKQPLAAIGVADLNAVLSWARSQTGATYSEIGFFGTSWGGLAGYAALSREVPGLSFIVSHSGLIEINPQTGSTYCKLTAWHFNILFGATTLPDGTCRLNGTGVLGAPLTSPIPILMLNGGKDHNTKLDIAQNWLSQARDQDACVSTVISASGGHGLGTWPEASADAARKAVDRWVSDVEAKRPAACRTQITLP
ncbi:MAG: prolyl oligopeptidase family serine peptidase [Alphaproteobacteria bacterium]|nr:prolyl oligopeptidase family serine peptidase [Alphaproteobacteria bacterium]